MNITAIINTFFLFVITTSVIGQVTIIDSGSSHFEKLNTGRSAIAWLEMNKPNETLNYLSKSSKVDKAALEDPKKVS